MTVDAPYTNIVILGHTGFIGSRVFESFQQASAGMRIHGISSSTVDLTKWEEVQTLADEFNDQTAVIMCAGVKPHVGESLEAFQENMAMAYNLARLLREHPVKQFVFLSTIIIYGEMWDDLRIDEDTPVNPDTYYGIAKFASEGLFRKVADGTRGISLLVFRPSLVYGPGDLEKPYGPSAFSRAILSQGHLTLWGDGSELRDFIFVEDVAALTREMTLRGCAGTFNVVSGESHSFRDIVETIKPLCASEFQVSNRDRTRPKIDQGFNADKLLKAVPDFTPTSFQEGISQTFLQVRSSYLGLEASEISAR